MVTVDTLITNVQYQLAQLNWFSLSVQVNHIGHERQTLFHVEKNLIIMNYNYYIQQCSFSYRNLIISVNLRCDFYERPI